MSTHVTLMIVICHAAMVTLIASNSCRFPDFLQYDGNPSKRWMYRVHNQGSRGASTHLYIIFFSNDVMEIESDISVIDPPDPVRLYRRQCILNTQEGYIVSQEDADTTRPEDGNEIQESIEFLCIQFTRVSEYIVLVSTGALTQTWSTSLCEAPLSIDSWPLVSFSIEGVVVSQHLPPGFAGGYEFLMRNPSTGQIMCGPDLFRSSRMEIGCLPDQDVVLTFSEDCDKSSLKMDDKQYVYSLGTWEQDSFTFMVLKKINSMNLWCLRIPSGEYEVAFEGQLYLDLECTVDNEQSNYLEMHFKRKLFDHLCEDISDNCDGFNQTRHVCENTNDKDACLEFCDKCTPLMVNIGPQTYCTFSTSYQGAWIHISETKRQEVRVSSNKFYIQQNKPLYCIPTNYNLTTRYPLIFSGTNGCFPRLTCVEFYAISPGYITYKIASTKYWPQDLLTLADPYDIVCSNDQFTGRYNHLTNRYTEPVLQSLVFDPRRPISERRGVNCSIGNMTLMHFMKLPGVGGKSCSGLFSVPCSDPSIIEVTNSDCETIFIYSSVYQCMSSMQTSDGRRIVVTVRDQSQDSELDDLNFFCWMFSASLKAMYLLPWADCDEETFNSVENTDVYRNKVITYTTSVFKEFCEETTTITTTTEDPTTTIVTSTEGTTWEFPDPSQTGTGSYLCVCSYHLYMRLLWMFIIVVFL